MRRNFKLCGGLALTLLCYQTAAWAEETLVLTPVKDSTLIEEAEGRLANSAGPVLFVGRTGQPDGQSIRRGLIAFDVAGALPEGATVTAVELTMKAVLAAGGDIDHPVTLHRLLEDWDEGSSSTDRGMGLPATASDATWVHRQFDTTMWSTPGGAFAGEASAVQSIGSRGDYSWSSSPDNQMVADVQFWLDDSDQNFGWLIRGNEEAGATAKVFGSHEADAVNRPTLTVTFEPGPADVAPKVITVDAGPGFEWVAKGQEGSPQIDVAAGDVLLFRMADTLGDHGLIFDDDDAVRHCDESVAEKPNAVLLEVPICDSGESEIGPSFAPIAPDAEPEVFTILIALDQLDQEVNFRCVVHGFMTGSIL